MASNYMQRNCPRCGRHRLGRHATDGCPVTDEVLARLCEFAALHGKRWKITLINLWIRGDDEGLLRQARNMIGHTDLYKVDINTTCPQHQTSHTG
jgi:hypothetical protein